jgi:hypothetical protein
MAYAKVTSQLGYVCDRDRLYPQMILFLKQDLDKELGKGTGDALIQRGNGPEYRWNPETRIEVAASFIESRGVLTEEQVQRLVELAGIK